MFSKPASLRPPSFRTQNHSPADQALTSEEFAVDGRLVLAGIRNDQRCCADHLPDSVKPQGTKQDSSFKRAAGDRLPPAAPIFADPCCRTPSLHSHLQKSSGAELKPTPEGKELSLLASWPASSVGPEAVTKLASTHPVATCTAGRPGERRPRSFARSFSILLLLAKVVLPIMPSSTTYLSRPSPPPT